MRIPWKYVGLAGLAGVTAGGAVVARRRRRAQRPEIGPDELRERLHERLAEVPTGPAPPPEPPAPPPRRR